MSDTQTQGTRVAFKIGQVPSPAKESQLVLAIQTAQSKLPISVSGIQRVRFEFIGTWTDDGASVTGFSIRNDNTGQPVWSTAGQGIGRGSDANFSAQFQQSALQGDEVVGKGGLNIIKMGAPGTDASLTVQGLQLVDNAGNSTPLAALSSVTDAASKLIGENVSASSTTSLTSGTVAATAATAFSTLFDLYIGEVSDPYDLPNPNLVLNIIPEIKIVLSDPLVFPLTDYSVRIAAESTPDRLGVQALGETPILDIVQFLFSKQAQSGSIVQVVISATSQNTGATEVKKFLPSTVPSYPNSIPVTFLDTSYQLSSLGGELVLKPQPQNMLPAYQPGSSLTTSDGTGIVTEGYGTLTSISESLRAAVIAFEVFDIPPTQLFSVLGGPVPYTI